MKQIFFILLFLSGLTQAAWFSRSVTAIVFHSYYCETFQSSIDDYMVEIGDKGHSAFYFCTDAVSTETLKEKIVVEAETLGYEFKNISGVNLYGPVITTTVNNFLKEKSDNEVYATLPMIFSNLEFTHRDNMLTNIYAGTQIPYPARWISHQLMRPEDLNISFDSYLKLISDHIAHSGEATRGEYYLERYRRQASSVRTISYLSFPYGELCGQLGAVSFPIFWFVAGIGRLTEGYSFWNRRQTDADQYATPMLYGLMIIFEGIGLYFYFNTEHYQGQDWNWKRNLLKKPLVEDGLLKADIKGKTQSQP